MCVCVCVCVCACVRACVRAYACVCMHMCEQTYLFRFVIDTLGYIWISPSCVNGRRDVNGAKFCPQQEEHTATMTRGATILIHRQ